MPKLTKEEEERDFLKPEDTNDLEFFKVKEKLLDIEKTVTLIAEKLGVKAPTV